MRSLVFAALSYYRGVHAMVVCGVGVAVAVLAGALVVGTSVRTSLRDLALARLGNTELVVSSTTFFRAQLAGDLGGPAVIAITGALVHEDTGRTAARVQVLGIDDAFVKFHGGNIAAPRGREAWISEALAEELQAETEDTLLLRVAKPSDIPLGTVQGRRDDGGERVRLTMSRVATGESLGEFSLSPAQGPALTLFVPIERLQADLDLEGRANAVLLGANDASTIAQRIRARAQLDDYGLKLRSTSSGDTVVVESRAGVMSSALADAIAQAAQSLGARAEPVLVHLANTIEIGDREIPYSIVAGRPMAGSLALNEWAAADLGARQGDAVELEYYVWSDTSGLETRRAQFTVSAVVPMSAGGGDPTFTPDYPGLTDAENVSAWDPPFPVDLRRVRKEDEDYWDEWRASPKAFVPIEIAQKLWATVHGSVSSIRVTAAAPDTQSAFARQLGDAVRQRIDPSVAGISIRNARADALAAAEGTTDFGEYFFYFSFFLVVAGLLLAALFFALGVEQRAREIGVLGAVGFSRRDIARVFGAEAALLAIIGSAIGIAGAMGYAAVIMYGLRTWWRDAVGTTALTLHLDWPVLVGGAMAALVAATGALVLSLRAALARSPRSLLGGVSDTAQTSSSAGVKWSRLGMPAAALGAVLIAATAQGVIPQVAGFFTAGGALMIAGLALFAWWLRRPASHVTESSVTRFGADYARWRPTRSVLSAALITFACFVIVSVGAFRKDAAASLDRGAGTGGFVLMAESVAPVMHNPNTEAGRDELGLESNALVTRMQVSRFRLKPGDDTSCLALYQPRNPRIVAPEDAFLEEGRFSFAASLAATPEERANPWRLLNRQFPDGAIPAIADQTSLAYVFHLGVGDDYVFTSDAGKETRLRIVGALADSVLQSEIIIPERAFVALFPRREGYGLWMIDTPAADATALATMLEDRLVDLGVDVVDARGRLQAYHRVENTYLSTFQALGGLGLLVGTLGLAAVLARNVLERRRELGLLQAVGFTPSHLRTIVLSESMLLVATGVVLGTVTAVIAVLPALLERTSVVPIGGLTLLLAAVTLTGLGASVVAARLASASSVVAALKGE
jgi:ABC-type lipoprotein release transport system permease subunit